MRDIFIFLLYHNYGSFLVDVYSFGVIAYETVGRKLLFADLVQHAVFDEIKVRRAVMAGERPPIVDMYPFEQTPDKVRVVGGKRVMIFYFFFQFFLLFTELVEACWHQQPMQRPQFPAILGLLLKLQSLYQETSPSVTLTSQQIDVWHSLLLSERMKERSLDLPVGKEENKSE